MLSTNQIVNPARYLKAKVPCLEEAELYSKKKVLHIRDTDSKNTKVQSALCRKVVLPAINVGSCECDSFRSSVS